MKVYYALIQSRLPTLVDVEAIDEKSVAVKKGKGISITPRVSDGIGYFKTFDEWKKWKDEFLLNRYHKQIGIAQEYLKKAEEVNQHRINHDALREENIY